MSRPGRGWRAVAVVSILYLPLAALAMGPYLLADPTVLLVDLPEGGPRHFVEGALAGRVGPYQAHLVGMISHTVTGALLMALGPYLLWTRPRRRTAVHVLAGRVYLATVLASMSGALTFLVGEPLEDAFTGPVFALGLWAMFVGTVASALLGWLAAVRHRIRQHVLWVCLNYGFIMSAPLLRIEWGLFGIAGVGETLEEVSPQSAIHVVALSTTLAVLGGLALADHLRSGTVLTGAVPAPTVPRAVVIASLVLGPGSLALVGSRYLEHGTGATTNLGWYLMPLLLLLAAVEWRRRRSLDSGRARLADEHLVLLCALAVSPALALLLSTVASSWLSLDPAVADATGVTLCGGVAVFLAVQVLDLREELSVRRRTASGVAAASHSRYGAPAS